MKTSRARTLYGILVLLLLTAAVLSACGDSSTSAPAATTAAGATTSQTIKVVATTAPATTAKATTAVAATTAANNSVSGLGITMTFPNGWNTNVQDKDGEGVLSGTNSDGSYITIYRFTKGDAVSGDLMTRTTNLVNNLKSSYPDLAILEQPNQLSADTARLSIEYTNKDTAKVNSEIVLVIDDATLKGTYLVEAGAEKAKFTDQIKNNLVSILNTIKTNPAAVQSQATTVASSSTNTIKGLGINLTFPPEWETQLNEQADQGSLLSVSPQGSYINIYRFTKGALVSGSLTDRASTVVDYLKSLYPDLTVIEQPSDVTSDTARFSAQYTDPKAKSTNLEVVLVIDDANLNATYLVEAGADKTKFDGQKDVLLNILSTLKTN